MFVAFPKRNGADLEIPRPVAFELMKVAHQSSVSLCQNLTCVCVCVLGSRVLADQPVCLPDWQDAPQLTTVWLPAVG